MPGEFEWGRLGHNPGRLFTIRGPDPEILVHEEVLTDLLLRADECHPDITLTSAPDPPHADGDRSNCLAPHPGTFCFHQAILKIKTIEHTVVYVIREYQLETNAWLARWPD